MKKIYIYTTIFNSQFSCREPLGARTTSFAPVNLKKNKKIKNRKRNRTTRRSSLLRKKKREAGWKHVWLWFFTFSRPVNGREGKREGNKEFRGRKLARKRKKRKKKYMARASNNRRCGNLTSMPLLKFGKLPSSNVSSSSIVSSSLRINKKK